MLLNWLLLCRNHLFQKSFQMGGKILFARSQHCRVWLREPVSKANGYSTGWTGSGFDWWWMRQLKLAASARSPNVLASSWGQVEQAQWGPSVLWRCGYDEEWQCWRVMGTDPGAGKVFHVWKQRFHRINWQNYHFIIQFFYKRVDLI